MTIAKVTPYHYHKLASLLQSSTLAGKTFGVRGEGSVASEGKTCW